MILGPTAPASLPPPGLPGLDPRWSRLVSAVLPDRLRRTWHVLDTQPDGAPLTVVCVHGNPTWSYLWRSVAHQVRDQARVVAVDHLELGWSERTGQVHRLADRIDQLCAVTDALGIDGPVVVVGHDWGGPISLGWAVRHLSQLHAVVLTNTAVAVPSGGRVPPLLQMAHTLPRASCVTTTAFLDTALRLAARPLPREVRRAYRSPYRGAARRKGLGDFVEDIPVRSDHRSLPALKSLRDALPALTEIPTLLLWGARDPVFTDAQLRDLRTRLPHAAVHRFTDASHLVVEDAPVAPAIAAFLHQLRQGTSSRSPRPPARGATSRTPLWGRLEQRGDDHHVALVELRGSGRRAVSWSTLHDRVLRLATGMWAAGIRPGERVGLLVPPGADLTAALYACWRAGAVVVVGDAGLGVDNLRDALRGAAVEHVIAVARALPLVRRLRPPRLTIAAGAVPPAVRAAFAVDTSLAELARLAPGLRLPAGPSADAEAAVLFTSGATGPAKGVVYRHEQLEAQRDAVSTMVGLREDDRLVAAFAPFALYGPALGIASAVPDMDVTSPRSLTASALAEAVRDIAASVVFASPAALHAVLKTADALTRVQRDALARVRLLLSAGAPVPTDVLARASALFGGAEAHTPYGMTEVLPVTDVTLDELRASSGRGVCVGKPLPGVEVRVAPLSGDGTVEQRLVTDPDVTGEIVVAADHVKDHYDGLWLTSRAADADGRHRTGDVGHLDESGRLWVEGRLVHVIVTVDAVLTPVEPEQRLQSLEDVAAAAVVGIGPVGAQQPVAVVQHVHEQATPRLATLDEVTVWRSVTGVSFAAGLVVPQLPVDVRHNSKVDRTRLAAWAEHILAGSSFTWSP